MPVLEIILIILLTGTWMGLSDIPFCFSGVLRSGLLRYREWGVTLFCGLAAGYLLAAPSPWEAMESSWQLTSPLAVLLIAVAAALSLWVFQRIAPPGSIAYSLFGAIWGWQLFAGKSPDIVQAAFSQVACWIIAPVVAGGIAVGFFCLLRHILRRADSHLIHISYWLRLVLWCSVAFAALAIGINNGPLFVSLFHATGIRLDLNSVFFAPGDRSLLWLFCLSVLFAVLALPLKERIHHRRALSNSVMPEQSIPVLLAVSCTLLLFSFPWFTRLLGAPAAVLSPIHLALGSLTGVALLLKAGQSAYANLPRLVLPVLLTPLLATGISYLLFVILSVYIPHLRETTGEINTERLDLTIPVILTGSMVLILFITSRSRRQTALRKEAQIALQVEKQQYNEAQQVLSNLSLRTIQLENENLNNQLDIKQKELINLALRINEQRSFYDDLYQQLHRIQSLNDPHEMAARLEELNETIRQKMTLTQEMSGFYSQAESMHRHFIAKLMERFPHLTEQEKRLATLLRLGFSTKEIAGLMNISPKSAEISRYRLRKRFHLAREENLIQFIHSL